MDNRKRRTEEKTEASIKRAIARNARKLTERLPKRLSGVLLACALVPSVGVMAVVTSSDTNHLEAEHAETMFDVEEFKVVARPLKNSMLVTAPAFTTSTTTTTSTSTSSTTTSTTTTTVVTTASTEPEPIAEPVVVESAPPEDEPETEPIEDAGTTAESEDAGCGITRVTDEELVMLAKTVAQEGGDCSYLQQKCVVWTVLNRMESCEWPNTVAENLNITEPRQFAYYSWKTYRSDHYQAVVDAVTEWENGESLLGPDYQYFYGDDWRNHFYGKNSPEYVPD